MAFLRLPIASDICNRRKATTFGNFKSCDGDAIPCSAWTFSGRSSRATGRSKLVERSSARFFGSLLNIGEGKMSSSSSLLDLSHFLVYLRKRGSSFRFEDIRACVLDRAREVQLTDELVNERGFRALVKCEFDAKPSVKEDPSSDSRNSASVILVGDVKRNQARKVAKRPLASYRAAKRTSLEPTSRKGNRSKYIRKDYVADDVTLASMGTQASVEHCNRILKELEQTCEEKAVAFFNWMRCHGKLGGNSAAYNLALRVLSRKEDWSAVRMLLDEMDSDPDCELNFQVFNSVIFVCAKRGLIARGTRWFRLMLEKGVQPNVATFGMLMGLYRKGGNLVEAEYAFDKMRCLKLQNVASYSAMITIYARLGLYKKSEEVICLMEEDKVTPNLENWLVQLNTYCQQGKLDEAEIVFESINKSGHSANIVVYNTLITGYGKVGNTKAARDLFLHLPVVGLEPDEVTYRSMVECYGRTDNYAEAKWYYKELKHHGFYPNSSNFYTMINLQARHGDESGAVQTLMDMKAMGCQLSSISSTLIQAYERVGSVEKIPIILKGSFYDDILLDPSSCSILALAYIRNSLVEDALQLLQEKRWNDSFFEDNLCHTLICSCKEASRYEDAVTIFSQMPKSEGNPNLHIACSMIDIYSCMNRFSDAEALYQELKASGVYLDTVAYTIIVRMYSKSGSLKDACMVLETMEKCKDIEPDVYLYRDMLRIYQQCSMHEKLANVYYKMLKRGDLWDEAMYNCVINCCGHALPVDEISRLFDEMIHCGHAASTITFNVMLDIYGKAGLLKKAEKVFQLARKLGLVDVISYNTLIAAYGQHKDFKSMKYVVQQMQYAGYPISLEAYNCMLDAYGKEDRLEEFNQVLQMMEAAKCISDHYTYNIMINIYGKKGWIEDVSLVLAELGSRGLEPDLYCYNSLIKAYGIAGMVEEAVGVIKEMRTRGIQPDKVTFVTLIAALQRNESYLEAVKWSLWLKQMEQKV